MRHHPDHHHRAVTAAQLEALSRLPEPQKAVAAAEMLSGAPLVSARVVRGFVKMSEGLLIAVLGVAAWFGVGSPVSLETATLYVPLILAIGVMLPFALGALGTHSIHALSRPIDAVTRVAAVWSVVFAVMIAAIFVLKSGESFSRAWAGTWFLLSLPGLMLLRIAVAALFRRWNRDGRLSRRAVLVGGGTPAAQLLDALDSSPDTDVEVVGIFDDRNGERSPNIVAGYPRLGTVGELIDFVRRTRIDLLIVTFPLSAEERLLQVLKKLWVLPVDIRLSAYAQKLRYRPRAYSYIGNLPFLDIFDKPLTDWGALLKWTEDKLVSAALLTVLSPLMLVIALAIKLDSRGPVFFRQKRYGFNNELIEVFKFRSMYVNQADAKAEKLVTRDDPRVTRVGRFIRKTSLDELPQLINVLKGDLSLVGPRPHPARAKAENRLYDEVVEGYFARHRVKPGITGWAQINGWRGETDTEEKILRRVEHDLYYIENWSLALDLYILLRTPFAIVDTENAY
jgi:Undecaprenyl-phosphate glucose phosphotransferase